MNILRTTVTGINPVLFNNPQAVDSLNKFKKAMSKITSKKNKTDEDFAQLHDLEMECKIYFEDGQVVVPTSWFTASIHGISFKRAKIAKKDSRSAIFVVDAAEFVPLKYDGMRKVKEITDIVHNHEFRHSMILKQGQVKVHKVAPIFHNWEFTIDIEFDDEIYDPDVLIGIIKHAAKYGGYGDFRPTFGRGEATVELINE